MPYFAKLFLYIAAIFVALIFIPCISGQDIINKPIKIEEYQLDAYNFEDRLARLDAFAVELQIKRKTRGYIIGYNKPDYPLGTYSLYLNNSKSFLVTSRGIDESRLTVIDGGYRDSAIIELWLVPEGAEPPMSNPTLNYKVNENNARLFDKPFVDHEGVLYLDELSLELCATELKKYPTVKARLSAFSSAGISRAKIFKLAKEARQILISKYSINLNRIFITTGKKEFAEIEFWIVPENKKP